jgi:hypothetical protein
VGFVVAKVALGQVFLQVLNFPVFVISLMFHEHFHPSITSALIFTNDKSIKQHT